MVATESYSLQAGVSQCKAFLFTLFCSVFGNNITLLQHHRNQGRPVATDTTGSIPLSTEAYQTWSIHPVTFTQVIEFFLF